MNHTGGDNRITIHFIKSVVTQPATQHLVDILIFNIHQTTAFPGRQLSDSVLFHILNITKLLQLKVFHLDIVLVTNLLELIEPRLKGILHILYSQFLVLPERIGYGKSPGIVTPYLPEIFSNFFSRHFSLSLFY